MSFCVNIGDSWRTVFDDEDHVNDPEDEESYESWEWIEIKKTSNDLIDVFVARIFIDNDTFDGYERTLPRTVTVQIYIGTSPVAKIDPFHMKKKLDLLSGVEKLVLFDSEDVIGRSYFDGRVSALAKDVENRGGPTEHLLHVIDEIDREYLSVFDDMDKEFIERQRRHE